MEENFLILRIKFRDKKIFINLRREKIVYKIQVEN